MYDEKTLVGLLMKKEETKELENHKHKTVSCIYLILNGYSCIIERTD